MIENFTYYQLEQLGSLKIIIIGSHLFIEHWTKESTIKLSKNNIHSSNYQNWFFFSFIQDSFIRCQDLLLLVHWLIWRTFCDFSFPDQV